MNEQDGGGVSGRASSLEELFLKLDAALPRAEGNSCGTCRECCTASGINGQLVNEIEFDLISQKVGTDRVDAFRVFVERQTDSKGRHFYQTCPYYDDTASGCGIYPYRPFSCRVFGHFQMEGTRLPTACVFEGKAKVVSRKDHYQEIPLAGELKTISRRYWGKQGPMPVRQATESPRKPSHLHTPLEQEDPIEQALSARSEGDYQRAVQLLNEIPAGSGYRALALYHTGQSLMLMDREQEAAGVFRQALELRPESWELHYNLGLSLFNLQSYPEAFRSFVKTVQLNPEHSLAWGFLGHMALGDGLDKQAALFLDNALNIDPTNATFQFQLAQALVRLDCPDKARQLFAGVLEMDGPDTIRQAVVKALNDLDFKEGRASSP